MWDTNREKKSSTLLKQKVVMPINNFLIVLFPRNLGEEIFTLSGSLKEQVSVLISMATQVSFTAVELLSD